MSKEFQWLFFLTAFFYTVVSFSQESETDIRMEKGFGGTKFYQGSRMVKPREVLEIMRDHPQAYEEFSRAKSNYDAAQVLGFVGGFMIGYPLGTAAGGGDAQWGIAAGGVGVLLLTIPLASGFNKHAAKALELYNMKGSSSRILLYPSGTGIRIIYRI